MGNLALIVGNLIHLAKAVNQKAIPVVKAYACKQCSSLASVSLVDNKITVKKCRCV